VVAPGDNLTFVYSVQNKGDTKLKDLKVVDSVFGPIKMPFKNLMPMQENNRQFSICCPAVDKKTAILHNITATAKIDKSIGDVSPKIDLEVAIINDSVPSSCPNSQKLSA